MSKIGSTQIRHFFVTGLDVFYICCCCCWCCYYQRNYYYYYYYYYYHYAVFFCADSNIAYCDSTMIMFQLSNDVLCHVFYVSCNQMWHFYRATQLS